MDNGDRSDGPATAPRRGTSAQPVEAQAAEGGGDTLGCVAQGVPLIQVQVDCHLARTPRVRAE
ncbi:MAG TPA: hypothetical protein VLA19_23505 [Herpetosiphonaceae bacterium]|nr:hypothetical protein [Herpetosiphonaceae bacterium]